MLSAKETTTMASEWVKLTSQSNEEPIHVNLANASTIESHKRGSRIWFLAGDKDRTVDVSETADEILNRLGEVQGVNRT
jgi:hypothetical protein